MTKYKKVSILGLMCLLLLPINLAYAKGQKHTKITHQSQVRTHKVKVTAYAPSAKCYGKNAKFASGKRARSSGHIALSKDLARKYKFGDKFILKVNGRTYWVTYSDRMPPKWHNRIDITMPSSKACREFGINKGELMLISQR